MDDLISRQAAIDAVKERITFAKAIRQNGDVYNLFESENAELEKAIANIKNLPSAEKTGWILVEDMLPSDCDCDWVLAQIQEDNGYLWIPRVMEYRKAKDDWYDDGSLGWLKDHNGAFKVVAWMPILPHMIEEGE